MKQNITVEQWNELSNFSKDRLIPILLETNLWKRGFGSAESMTIGRMIEFLFQTGYFPGEYHISSLICDELWEAVKQVLEENNK